MDFNSIYFKDKLITDVYIGSTSVMSFDRTTVWEYEYSGGFQMFKAPKRGSYKLECWGAEGGYRNSSSATRLGKGGYACGEISLNKNDVLYIYVGQFGNDVNNNTEYAFNGGGIGSRAYQAGGGATDIRLLAGNWDNEQGLLSRILVAGGGGSVGAVNKAGGAGGGRDGISRTENYGTGGVGGSQVSAGSERASFGKGGSGVAKNSGYGGAGGGGWYGGGGVTPDSSGDDDRGGGGGSGFTLTQREYQFVPSGYIPTEKHFLSNAELKNGTLSFTSPQGTTVTGNSNHGFARITLL